METGHSVIASVPHPERLVIRGELLERLRPRSDVVEAAGILLGVVEGVEAVVEEAVELARGVSSFRIEPVSWMKAVLAGEERGLDYIGVYHTHPGGRVRPSPLDIRYMMECPGEVWLIVARGEAAAWTWGLEGVRRLVLRVV